MEFRSVAADSFQSFGCAQLAAFHELGSNALDGFLALLALLVRYAHVHSPVVSTHTFGGRLLGDVHRGGFVYSANALRCAVFSSSGRKKVAATVLMSRSEVRSSSNGTASTKKPCKWPSSLTRALPVGIGAVRRRNPSTALRYSAAAGDATLGELAEWDPEFAEPFAPGALISASGSSERRDFPSK